MHSSKSAMRDLNGQKSENCARLIKTFVCRNIGILEIAFFVNNFILASSYPHLKYNFQTPSCMLTS